MIKAESIQPDGPLQLLAFHLLCEWWSAEWPEDDMRAFTILSHPAYLQAMRGLERHEKVWLASNAPVEIGYEILLALA